MIRDIMARMLKRRLEGILTESEAEEFVSAFDQIGQIIVVRIPDALLYKRREIGEALLEEVKVARSVFCQVSAVEGEHRVRSLEIIAGVDDTTTPYKESGCTFAVDVENAFFSPRLSYERERIAGLASDGETILNMFGGVGMFSIVAAMKSACTVYSIDSNPVADALCRRNVDLNEYYRRKRKGAGKRRKMAGTVIPICGEASQVLSDAKFRDVSDRTLMLLPERSDDFLRDAVRSTKSGGIVHYYSHVHADSKGDAPALSERHLLDVMRVNTRILGSRIVRAVGPRYYQTVVDAQIFKDGSGTDDGRG